MNDWLWAIPVGVGATLSTDLWSAIRRRLFGIPLPNYGLVGRWLVRLAGGHVSGPPIPATPPVPGERLVGWVAHYVIGIAFAATLLVVSGPDWLRRPTILPALAVGLATVLAPFLVLQPAMGAGIAARRAPDPTAARLQSLLTHAVFGVGLYVSAWITRLLMMIAAGG